LLGLWIEKTCEAKIVSALYPVKTSLESRWIKVFTTSLLAVMLLTGCAKRHAATHPPVPLTIHSPEANWTETGLATWYGEPYHGRRAANGEVFDMEKLTAAHRTLAFDTWVRVTNLDNGREVDVRITDRGPFVEGRIIDLSLAAAREVDMVRSGVARVKIKTLSTPAVAPTPVEVSRRNSKPVAPAPVETSRRNTSPKSSTIPTEWFGVQLAAFRDQQRATEMRDRIASACDCEVNLVEKPGSPVIYRVIAGRESSRQAADNLRSRLRNLSAIDPEVRNSAMVVLWREAAQEQTDTTL
jgi:rare lipoprotein A